MSLHIANEIDKTKRPGPVYWYVHSFIQNLMGKNLCTMTSLKEFVQKETVKADEDAANKSTQRSFVLPKVGSLNGAVNPRNRKKRMMRDNLPAHIEII